MRYGTEEPDSSSRVAIAGDIEYFETWWKHSEAADNVKVRHGNAALRRLLVEDDAGTAWRQLEFQKNTRSHKNPDEALTMARKILALDANGKLVLKLPSGSVQPVSKPADPSAFPLIDCSSSMAGGKIAQAKHGALAFAEDARKKLLNPRKADREAGGFRQHKHG